MSDSVKYSRSFESDQGRIRDEIEDKQIKYCVRSDTSAMADIFEAKKKDITSYESAFKPNPDQVGFITLIQGKVVGMDIFGSPKVFPNIHQKLMRGYILDAIDPSGKESGSEKVNEKDALSSARTFVKAVKAAKTNPCKSVGEGEDVRLESSSLNGFALLNKGSVVHLAAFPEDLVHRT